GLHVLSERFPQQYALGGLELGRSALRGGHLVDARAVDVYRLPRRITQPIPPRVVKDRIEPRPQVRPAFEPLLEAQRLDHRVLYEVFRVGPIAREAERGSVQRVEVPQHLVAERVGLWLRATSEHRRHSGPMDVTRWAVWLFPQYIEDTSAPRRGQPPAVPPLMTWNRKVFRARSSEHPLLPSAHSAVCERRSDSGKISAHRGGVSPTRSGK